MFAGYREGMNALIVEASTTQCAIYEACLVGLGFKTHTATTLVTARTSLLRLRPDLLLFEVELPDGNGLDLLADASALMPVPVCIVMAGRTGALTEQALRQGAADFITKPFDSIRLRRIIQRAMHREAGKDYFHPVTKKRDQLCGLVGSSPQMRAVFDAVERVSVANAALLITGETGTGKELVARAVHDLSSRAPKPFIVVNCAAMITANFEREFYGEHSRMAATDQLQIGLVSLAEGGSLFLDEVSELDYAAQSSLLRFLENGALRSQGSEEEVSADVRVIASSNRDLLEEIRAGRLREDLYYRLQVLSIRLPPLRERITDVPEIASVVLDRLAVETGRSLECLSTDSAACLMNYAWPGNVRQLENTLRWIITMLDGSEIGPDIIGEALAQFSSQSDSAPSITIDSGVEAGAKPVRPLWMVEKEAIQYAINLSDGNISRAAILLEVAPSTIYRKVQAWQKE